MKAIWDISNKCNLHCTYCGADACNNITEGTLSIIDIEKMILNIKTMVDEVDLYGGEPLIIKDIHKILQCFTKYNIKVNITTNGQVNTSILEDIVKDEIQINSLIISMDGNESENDKYRGLGAYKKAVNFLEKAISLKKENGKEWNIGISAVVTDVNVKTIIHSIDLWMRKGVDFIVVSPIAEIGGACNNKNIFPSFEMLLNMYEDIACYSIKNNMQNQIIIDVANPLLAEYLNAKYGTNYIVDAYGCEAADNVVTINSYGHLKSCRSNPEIVADLKEDSLEDVYDRFSSFLRKKRLHNSIKICDCIHREVCNVCCFAVNKEKEPICYEVEKRYKKFIQNQNIIFELDKKVCLYDDNESDFFEIFYYNTKEFVEYDSSGYKILNLIHNNGMTSKEISDEIGVDNELVFRFLIQEHTKKHINIIKG